jgi:hypothetical protein
MARVSVWRDEADTQAGLRAINLQMKLGAGWDYNIFSAEEFL